MRFNVITAFPEIILNNFQAGVVGRAVQKELVQLHTINPRQFTSDVHKTIDDRPFGGGDGMVMLYEPLAAALDSIAQKGHVVYLSAQGNRWTDEKARQYARNLNCITLISGRYAGVDQRLINRYVQEEISIGDYILSGGELAASVLIDSVTRFLPNVLGNEQSMHNESFADGLLEAPLFTRPQSIAEQTVPSLLMGGDHLKIAATRRLLSLIYTLKKRPDLIRAEHVQKLGELKPFLKYFTDSDWRSCGMSTKEVEGLIDDSKNYT